MFSTPKGASWLPVLSNGFLVAAKLVVALTMGSLAVLSEALDSSVDLLSSFIAFLAIRFAARPPDEGHPSGHGKAENVSGVVESLLILGAAGYVAYAAVDRLFHPRALGLVDMGIGVMVVSLVINFLVSRHLLRVAHRHESLALEASARHRAGDVYTSLGVLGGLVAVRLSGLAGRPLYVLDPLIALAVAAYVAWIGVAMFRKAFAGLMDARLPEEEEEQIRQMVQRHHDTVGLRELRSRRSGRQRRIALVLELCQYVTVGESHALVTHIEEEVRQTLPESHIITHVEPCTPTLGSPCPVDCPSQRGRA